MKGKIGVLIESHFDETEFVKFQQFFPANDFEVEFISYLWNQPNITFTGNDFNQQVTVTKDVSQVNFSDYAGIILIGGYAMDRLRYQETIQPGTPNQSPAVNFLRQAVQTPHLKIGAICHSLWLFCADPSLIQGKRVTCAHNIVCDVQAAGGVIVFEGNQTATICVDGNLITGRHPGVTDQFMQQFLDEINKAQFTQQAKAS